LDKRAGTSYRLLAFNNKYFTAQSTLAEA